MATCYACHKEIDDHATRCPYCTTQFDGPLRTIPNQDPPSYGVVLGFFAFMALVAEPLTNGLVSLIIGKYMPNAIGYIVALNILLCPIALLIVKFRRDEEDYGSLLFASCAAISIFIIILSIVT